MGDRARTRFLKHIKRRQRQARTLTELFAAYVLPLTTGFLYMSIMVSIFSIFDCQGYNGDCKGCYPSASEQGTPSAYFCGDENQGDEKATMATLVGSTSTTWCSTKSEALFQTRDDLCLPNGCYAGDAQQCFTGAHTWYTFAALLGFGLYFPSATLTPFQVYFVDPTRDIRYPPLYVLVLQLMKCFLALCGTLLTDFWYVPLGASLIVNCTGVYFMVFRTPCNVMLINSVKAAIFAMAAWSAFCAILTKQVDPDAGMIALIAGWLAIPAIFLVGWQTASPYLGRNRKFHDHQIYSDQMEDHKGQLQAERDRIETKKAARVELQQTLAETRRQEQV
jgi:hypothetical protein